MNFLIIYEVVPEATLLYALTTDDEKIIEVINRCHCQYVNLNAEDKLLIAVISDIEKIPGIVRIFDSSSDQYGDIEISGDRRIIHTGMYL